MDEPSLLTKLFSLAKAVTKQVVEGLPSCPDDEIKRRAEICSTCPSLIKDEYKCGECGCYLKYKISWATQDCPLGKWEK